MKLIGLITGKDGEFVDCKYIELHDEDTFVTDGALSFIRKIKDFIKNIEQYCEENYGKTGYEITFHDDLTIERLPLNTRNLVQHVINSPFKFKYCMNQL